MSENDDTTQQPQSSTFEVISHLTNIPLAPDPNESQQLETLANEMTTNIIKDASRAASAKHDNNKELPISTDDRTTDLDKSEYSTTNDNGFDNEDIQKQMNGVIDDFRPRTDDDTYIPRKSVTSNHLHDDQINTSTPNIINPSAENNSNEAPVRSMSESDLIDHHKSNEQSSPLPIRQDESISDGDDLYGIKAAPTIPRLPTDDSIDQNRSEQENQKNNQSSDDDFFNTKTATINDDYQRPSSAIKQNGLDETTHFGTTSPTRVRSGSSKRSIPIAPDETSVSGDEKRTQLSSTKIPDDTGNDTDRDNQEVAVVARRPSRAMSPFNRPRSPTPDDSRKAPANIEPTDENRIRSPNLNDNQYDDEQQKQDFQTPPTIISPGSRRESTNKADQQRKSRPTSAVKTNFDDNSFQSSTHRLSTSDTDHFTKTDEQSKLIKLGEQLQIPTDDLINERMNSPPPSPSGVKSIALINPLLGSTLVQKEQDNSRPSSETNRKSPTISTISNDKVIDGDILPSKSRRESTISQQQINNTDQKLPSRRESHIIDEKPQISGSPRASTSQQQDELDSYREQQETTRRTSNVPQEPTSHRESPVPEQQTSDRRQSTTDEPQTSSNRGSVTFEQKHRRNESTGSQNQVPSKRTSIAPEQQSSSRRESTAHEQQSFSRRESTAHEQQPSSRRESTAAEQKHRRNESTGSQNQVPSKRTSIAPEQQSSSRRESTTDEPQISSNRGSVTFEQKHHRNESTGSQNQVPSKRTSIVPEEQSSSRRESTAHEQQSSNRRESTAHEQQSSSRRESTAVEQKHRRNESTGSEQQTSSKRGSYVPEQQQPSRRESINNEQKTTSRRSSRTFEQQSSSRKETPPPEQQLSTRRESHLSEQQSSDRRQSLFDEQKTPSKPASQRTSLVEQQQIPSRRESQIQGPSSRRTSTNRDNQSSSPRRSSIVNVSPSRDSSRRNSSTKQEQLSTSDFINKDSQQIKHETNPSDIDVPTRSPAKSKQEHRPSIDKRQKSSSTADENDKRRTSFQQRSEQQSKRNSNNLVTDETVVTPIIMDSSKIRQHNGKHASTTDSDYEPISISKFPPVNSSFQHEKQRRSETLNKQQIPISNRSERKPLSSSHAATTPSDDERATTHWSKHIPIPSIHFSDNEISSSREDQPRPKSPNVEQIAERNQLPSPPLIDTKKRRIADGQKRKEQQRLSRRSTSADSANQIRLVDDKSLDSTSETNFNLDRHKRRHIKPKTNNVETNTDQVYDSPQQQRSLFDEQELTSQKPLKATKPMSDHLHSIRRRTSNKDQSVITPESDTYTYQRTVKQSKDSNQEKEPVNVNVTVVVKKFASANSDGTSRTTAEAFVEQKPQQYFETVQHTSETDHKEKHDENTDRPKTTDQQQIKTPERIIDHNDRHTLSDTEQIITDNQKKRRRPKRISRTCQTYECVFRRMEREQNQDLRATSDTEKNIQTRKSQLRPRKKSPKRHGTVYLTPDSFKVEELLPKQYHQSRRNLSKSSAIARSLSPQGGKLLILRPTLPFHHTDAVNVQRVCLQYAIDLIPNENASHGSMPTPRNKSTVLRQPEHTNTLPMISGSVSSTNIPTNKSNIKEKSASYKSEDYTHQRKNGGAV